MITLCGRQWIQKRKADVYYFCLKSSIHYGCKHRFITSTQSPIFYQRNVRDWTKILSPKARGKHLVNSQIVLGSVSTKRMRQRIQNWCFSVEAYRKQQWIVTLKLDGSKHCRSQKLTCTCLSCFIDILSIKKKKVWKPTSDFYSSQKNYVLNKTRRYKYYGSFTPEIYYTIAIANATAILFYREGEEIGITIVKMGVQPVLEPNGNHNRNLVINLRCE